MKKEKITFEQAVSKLKVKDMIKSAKAKGLIRPLTEAFEKTPVEKEAHKGNPNYFLN